MTSILPYNSAVLVLDGGLGSELETRGVPVGSSHLWSAELLISDPAALRDVHAAYIAAGADIVTTASYQASFPGVVRYFEEKQGPGDYNDLAKKYIADSVLIAQEARDAFWKENEATTDRIKPLVAASIGPYGAYLAAGQEYTGDYGFTDDKEGEKILQEFHKPRLDALLSANPDIIALETIPTFLETKVLLDLLAKTKVENPPSVWLAFSINSSDETALADGSPLTAVVDLIAKYRDSPGLRVTSIGTNCLPPHRAHKALHTLSQELARVNLPLPLVVYPNSGEIYNGTTKEWAPNPEGVSKADDETNLCFHEFLPNWYASGARLVGGCCRTGPSDISELRGQLQALARQA
ncbi:uncharacterized protein SAPINGB_P004131 [Magnusiomyces paraingens]|uniref:Hcy-binding domain-containing protein n=1 Tax=Magnusiomyces paraingens TaxID=2606893 RepID=A0A5E8BV46_9ASCO|nr:uncharacterized protein SAPINGB_P004131 [Saprochaete ingens]VVT54549.1 unnamed protein product [Saprochaete ingens]